MTKIRIIERDGTTWADFVPGPTERAYFGYEAELRAEIERLRKALLVAESCAALSGIGVDAHMCAVELGKETMGKLIAAEKLNAELVAALELLADSKTAYGDIARAALAKVKENELMATMNRMTANERKVEVALAKVKENELMATMNRMTANERKVEVALAKVKEGK